MAETVKATTAAKSEFWFNDGTALYRAHQVKSFAPPSPVTEKLDSTSLEDDAKTYIPGDTDYGEFTVKINYRPLSDTDTKLEAWAAAQTERAFLINEAVRGVLVKSRAGTSTLLSYVPDDAARGSVWEATLTLQASGPVASSSYVAP